ncbi:unnamed protein product [Protopolystoma xenopodis]|uniref:Uncharacterized protein n=1 Tax=Protopolystoma xenopodis TaxID=117903 RepID=A0A3S4ZFQ7_9PLAT|nr:unnamed protein product [Protopolystoma xenopodis]
MLGLHSCVGQAEFAQNNSAESSSLLTAQRHNPLFPPQDATSSPASSVSFHESTDFPLDSSSIHPDLGTQINRSVSIIQVQPGSKSLINASDATSPDCLLRPHSADLSVARAHCSVQVASPLQTAISRFDRSETTSASRQSSPGLVGHRNDSIETLMLPLFAFGRIASDLRSLINRYVQSESVLYCLEIAGFTTAPVIACLADDAEIRELESFIQHAGQIISNPSIRLALLGPVYAMHPAKFRLPFGAICGLRLALKELASSSLPGVTYSMHGLTTPKPSHQSNLGPADFSRLISFGGRLDDSGSHAAYGNGNGSNTSSSSTSNALLPSGHLPPPLGSNRLAAAAAAAALLPGMTSSLIRGQVAVAAAAAAAARSLVPPTTPSSTSASSPPVSAAAGGTTRTGGDSLDASHLHQLFEAAVTGVTSAGCSGTTDSDNLSSSSSLHHSSSLPLFPFLSSSQPNGAQAFHSPDFQVNRLDDFGRFNLERLKQHSVVRVSRIAARHFANAPHLVQGRDFDVEMEVSLTSEGFQRVTGLFYCQLCRAKRDRAAAVRFSVARNRTPVMSNVISHLKIHFQYLGQQSLVSSPHLISPHLSQLHTLLPSPSNSLPLVNFCSSVMPDQGQAMSAKLEAYSDPDRRVGFPLLPSASSQHSSLAFSQPASAATD